MSSFANAEKFFHACESLKGWDECAQYVADGATFDAQAEPLVEITSVKGYVDWMQGVGLNPLKGCSYDVHATAYDENNATAIFFATFNGKHVGEGGPVPPTNQETHSHYVYILNMDGDGKVEHMKKIWNAPWAMRELGWT